MIHNSNIKIALVHDYLKEYGGAERVLMALHEIWPEAPIYTAFWIRNSSTGRAFAKAKIVQSWFGRLPFCDKLISPLRFLLPLVWKSFDFSKYDLVISSASWAVTKGFAKGKTKEICYCHTPPRYLYGYETSRNWQNNPLIKAYALIINHFMRMYDFRQAQKVTWFVANSREVRRRIKKFYRRESLVINPPVEIKFKIRAAGKAFGNARQNSKFKIRESYFLTGGRLEKAKNFDLVVKASKQLKLPLIIYGSGSQEKYLRSIAGSMAKFVGRISDEKRQDLMAKCRAFIVAATDEDFGITPVEAMAAGRPVIAFRGGGYLETVVEGKTGEFFDEPSVKFLVRVLKNFRPEKYKKDDCVVQARKFSKERFKKEIRKFVQ